MARICLQLLSVFAKTSVAGLMKEESMFFYLVANAFLIFLIYSCGQAEPFTTFEVDGL
jgi:hypothetical protein